MALLERLRALFRRGRRHEAWLDVARRHGVWPVAASFETFYALTQTGEVVASEWPDFRARLPVEDARERNWILAEASARYPEFAHLRPVRRPEDQTCPTCGGDGRLKFPGAEHLTNILCECGGLGWLPAGYLDPHRDRAI